MLRSQIAQRLPQAFTMESHVFADGKRGGGMVDAKGKQMHASIFRYRGGLSNNFSYLTDFRSVLKKKKRLK
jgi:hypothetical protein